LRRAAVAAALVLPLAGLFAAFAGYDVWKDSHWHPSGVGGVTAMAFSPANQRILLTATSVPMDGVNDLWDVANPARPRLLRALAAPLAPLGQQSYAPGTYYTGDIAFSADGRLLAAASGNDQVALFSVADPARAARLATLPGGAGFVFAVAFSPDGRALADVSYRGTAKVFSIADPARPRLAATMPLVPGRAADRDCGCFPADYALAFGADGRTLTTIEDIPVSGRFDTAGYPTSLPPWQKARDFIFTWDVTHLPSARLLTSLARDVAASGGNSSLPLIAPRGQAVASGASFGFFGVSLRPLPPSSP
jgi:WD40 repeat protein